MNKKGIQDKKKALYKKERKKEERKIKRALTIKERKQ